MVSLTGEVDVPVPVFLVQLPEHLNGTGFGDAAVSAEERELESEGGGDDEAVHGVGDGAGERFEVLPGGRVERGDVECGAGVEQGGAEELVAAVRDGLVAALRVAAIQRSGMVTAETAMPSVASASARTSRACGGSRSGLTTYQSMVWESATTLTSRTWPGLPWRWRRALPRSPPR
jgi:hypothetical protein